MHKKTDECKKTILEKLNHAFMFQSLSDKEKDIVIEAMVEMKCPEHENVIKEGD